MDKKKLIRKSYFLKRKKLYFEINESFFSPLLNLLKRQRNNKKLNISIYFPSFFEVNVLKILNIEYFKKYNFLLPRIEDKNLMNFYKWKKNQILLLNKYGIPEPRKSKKIIPNIFLVPLLAFDNNKNRLGYGKGFYDKYLHKLKKLRNKILIVGIAFSFQKHHNLPINKKDFKLDYVITEKGMI
tara:strand:+ start:3065 stop:3616 length:552 start_codon:yes stop_codon:yes gene_type:complete